MFWLAAIPFSAVSLILVWGVLLVWTTHGALQATADWIEVESEQTPGLQVDPLSAVRTQTESLSYEENLELHLALSA